MIAYPPLWCRVGDLEPAPAVPELHGDGWLVRCHLEPALPVLGTRVAIELVTEGRPARHGHAFVVSITRDGDPAGTGWPCLAVLLAAGPLTEPPHVPARPERTPM